MANKSDLNIRVCVLSSVISIFLIHTSQSQKTSGTFRSTTTARSSISGNQKTTDSLNIIEDKDSKNNKAISEKNKGKNKTTENPNNNKRFKNGTKNGNSFDTNNDLNYATTEEYSYSGYGNNETTNSTSTNSTSSEKSSISMIGIIGKKGFYYVDQNVIFQYSQTIDNEYKSFDQMRFGGAIEFCISHNMTLAAIESEFENNLVKNFFDSVENHKHGWLGATDGFSRKGDFLWMKNREPIKYYNWADGYPKSDEKTSCINFNGGDWKNWSCDYYGTENSAAHIRPICQKEI